MKKFLFVFFFFPILISAQYRIGQDIYGESSGDVSGRTVSVSNNGSIVAVGAEYNNGNGIMSGHVRIYQLDSISLSWIQLGQDIDGEAAYDMSGSFKGLSVNADGTRVAIGAPYNDASSSSNTNHGHVRIFEWNSTSSSWIQLGQDIDGESAGDESGTSVSINYDGNIVAIGSPNHYGNSPNTGHVRIFSWDGTSWIQIGQNITDQIHPSANDYFGYSVSISDSGNIVAIGAPTADFLNGANNNVGNVFIYEFDGINWNLRGNIIEGQDGYDESGRSLSMSGDGNTLAIGSPGNDDNGQDAGHVRIYQWDGNNYTQIGQSIDGENTGDGSGGDGLSISDDGKIVAIGADHNSNPINNISGHVRIYKYNGNIWTQIGSDIDGEATNDDCGYSVSLSSNGHIIAIGSPLSDVNGSNSGQLRLFGLAGCTDPNYIEYNSNALIEDSTCTNLVVYGCTDSSAFTYNSSANTDDGSCCYPSFNVLQKGQTFYDSQIGGHTQGNENRRASISYDGNRIALGMTDSNEVIVMQWNGMIWEYIGSPIQFSDPRRVNISGDGNVVAIGNANTFEIYEYDLSWNLVYSNSTTIKSQLALNYNGETMVVGADNDVKVFSKGSLGWDNEITMNLGNGNYLGYKVDIDSTGNTIVCGLSNHLQVWRRFGSIGANNWTQLGSNIYSSQVNNFGYSVSISSDGNTVAGGGDAITSSGQLPGTCPCAVGCQGNEGYVEIYKYYGSSWTQSGPTICGIVGSYQEQVSLSGDAKKLVISPYSDHSYYGGGATYYEEISGVWTQMWSTSGYGRINGKGNSIFIEASNENSIGSAHVYQLNLECKSGCTDSLALNYDPTAIMDDGSCCFDCGRIEGLVFEDIDMSTSYDSLVEPPFGNQIIQLEKSSGELNYLTTNVNGTYSFIVDTGQQVITYSPPSFWQSSNNTTQYSIDIQTDSTYSGLDFGIIPEFTKGDMFVDLTTSNTVCNNTTTLWITVKNLGTETITNVDLDLWVDPAYSIINTGGGNTIGNYISWNIPGDFFPYVYTGEEQTFSVDVQIPSGPINSSFIDSVRVTPVQFNLVELDSTNNFAQASNTLLCSYDPNDKQVLPQKCYYQESDTLDYTIRFQNTGNYFATTVRLVDSLDLEKLDILSFQVIGASHDYEWSLKSPSVLEVIFDSIMLVDSSVSFVESQGFFKYRIIVRDTLPDLFPTATPAYIYFDLNAPIVTNLPEVNFIDPAITYTNIEDICVGQSVTVGSNTYTASGVYTDALSCDSVVVTQLTVNNPTTSTSVEFSCGSYTWLVNNQTYTSSGTYTSIINQPNGCTHTEILNLTINSSTSSYSNQTVCDSYLWPVNNQLYSSSGVYVDVNTNSNGCVNRDTLNLTINPSTSSTQTTTECDSYNWNGSNYTSSGIYSIIFTSTTGCDSTAVLDLTINPSTSSVQTTTECDSYTWPVNNQQYTSSGVYVEISTNANGCVNTDTLDLTINPSTSSTQTTTECDSYTWNGSTYTTSGVYSLLLVSSSGCDSIATLDLTINDSTSSITTLAVCDSYTWPVNNQMYTSSGVYVEISTNASGCVNTDTLDLTINPITSSTQITTECDSYTWNGSTYTTSGVYSLLLVSSTGCDSTAVLDLTIDNSYSASINIDICSGDSVIIGGTPYYTSGSYNDVYISANGCDSTITTNLTVSTAFSVVITQQGSELVVNASGGTAPYGYFWSTGEIGSQITPTVNGLYWLVVSDQDDCYSDTVYYTVDWIKTSVEEIGVDYLRIYPNPSQDIFNIEFTSLRSQDVTVRVYNVIGELQIREDLTDFTGDYKKVINLNQYEKGVYMLEIVTDNGTINKKLILQ